MWYVTGGVPHLGSFRPDCDRILLPTLHCSRNASFTTDQHATAESIVDTRVPNRSLPFKILAVSLHLPLSLLSHRLIQVAYHGVPEKAYEVFVNALHSCYLKQSLVIPDLEDHNPAGNSVYTVSFV